MNNLIVDIRPYRIKNKENYLSLELIQQIFTYPKQQQKH